MNIIEPVLTKTAEATVATAQLLDGVRNKQAENYGGIMSPEDWDNYEKAINSISENVQKFVYKCGEWTVRLVSNGCYICTLGAYKVTVYTAKCLVWGVAAIQTAGQIVWETLSSVFNAVLSTATTAFEAANGFVREAGSRLRATVIDRATKREVTPKVTSKAITVMA